MTVFYDRLRELAASCGLSFRKIEQEMGYPHNSLANYRQGKDPGAKRILELSNYFDVSPSYLLCATSSRITSEIEIALGSLSEERKAALLEIVKRNLKAQENGDPIMAEEAPVPCNTIIPVVELLSVGDGDTVWKKGRTKEIEIPADKIPDEYDTVVQIIGKETFFRVDDQDILFIKFDIERPKSGFSPLPSKNIKFTELPQMDGSVFYIKNYSENNASFSIGEVAGIYHMTSPFNFARGLT